VRRLVVEKTTKATTTSSAEMPVSERKTGIAQGVLRVNYRSANKSSHLVRVFKKMRQSYPHDSFYVTMTCNVVLRHRQENTFQVFYGQSFGRAKSLFMGSGDADVGKLDKAFLEFTVSNASQAAALPTDWSLEDFRSLYSRHFDSSNVEVYEIISLVYFFSKGLEDYQKQKTRSARPEVVNLFD
jgi:hypothetical protein